MRATKRWLGQLIIVGLIVALTFGISAEAATAQSRNLTYNWSDWVPKPNGGWWQYRGNYFGQSDWGSSNGYNWFTRHESVVLVETPTSDIKVPATTLYFYHGGGYQFEISPWEWDPCCYYVPPGEIVFGGHTNAYGYAYSASSSGVDRGTWAFLLCDAAGCYSGVSDDRSWTLW